MKQVDFEILSNDSVNHNNSMYNQFGIVGKFEGESDKIYISNITTDFDEITSLVDRLNSLQVSVLHLKDVIEDFVQEKSDVKV